MEEGAALDEPMAKLLTVLPWPYVGGEDDARGRREDGVGEVAAAKRFVAGVVES